LLTDRFDLAAWEVVELYRRRWQIELFFRWLKRQLGVVRVLGRSLQAVWLTVLVGGIAVLIWLLLDEMGVQPSSLSRISWLGAVAEGLKLAINLSG
jgi:IS4 transposase